MNKRASDERLSKALALLKPPQGNRQERRRAAALALGDKPVA